MSKILKKRTVFYAVGILIITFFAVVTAISRIVPHSAYALLDEYEAISLGGTEFAPGETLSVEYDGESVAPVITVDTHTVDEILYYEGASFGSATLLASAPASAGHYWVTLKEGGTSLLEGVPFDIEPKAVKLSVSAIDTTYSGAAKTVTATYKDVGGATCNAKATLVGANNVDAGSTFRYTFEIEDGNYKIAPGDIDLDRYSIVGGVAGTVVYTINKATIPTCILEQKEIPVYDGQVQRFSFDPEVLAEDVQGVAGNRDAFSVKFKLSGESEESYAENREDILWGKDAGEYVFDCMVEMTNHETEYRQVTFSIAPRPVTVEYTSQRKEVFYGDVAAWEALGAEMSGNEYYLTADLAEGDSLFDIVDVDMVGTSGSVISALGPDLDAGRYDLVVTPTGNGNYDVTIDLGLEAFLTVKRNPISVVLNVEDTVYGTAFVAPTVGQGIDVTGWKGSDDASLIRATNLRVSYASVGDTADRFSVASGAWTTDVPAKAGEYYVVAEISGLSNYEDATVDKKFTIAKKKLYVAVEDRTVTYGDEAPAYTANIIGFAYEETVADLDGELVFVCGYARRDGVGTKPIVASGYTSADYDIVYVGGTLTVEAKDITVTADNKTSVFGDALALLTVQADLVEGDVAEDVYSLSSAVSSDSKAGRYAIVVTAKENKNYAIMTVDGVYTITERKTVLAGGKTRYYKEVSAEEAASEEGVDLTVLFKNAAADPAKRKEVKVYAGELSITFNANAIQAASSLSEVIIKVKSNEDEKTADIILPNVRGTVEMSYDEAVSSEKTIKVFRIGENGKKTVVDSVYRDGTITFDADGSARYVVKSALTTRSIVIVVAVCVLAGFMIALAVFIFLKIEKRSKTE